MAQDSLGKKTHLPAVLNLYWNRDQLWPTRKRVDLTTASKLLQGNSGFARSFTAKQWPRDIRSVQAYVHRFFRWLELPTAEQVYYPTVVLAAGDSIAFRQSLWLDFVFGTPEAQRAVEGLWKALQAAPQGFVEVSPQTHAQFCDWVGIPKTDNTRRGPFARWLEEAGLGFALPERGAHETGIVVPKGAPEQLSVEALVYGLYAEFAKPFDRGALRPVEITNKSIEKSLTIKALMLSVADIPQYIVRAVDRGYAQRTGMGIGIEPQRFADALRQMGPLPSQSWVKAEIPEGEPILRETLNELVDFPDDDCFATEGSPFDKAAELETTKRRKRDAAFVARIGDAYRHRCIVSGKYFRSPSGRSWYGDAVHIVPHSGIARDSSKVFGKSVLSNGLYMTKFNHWCFDRGWFGIDPIMRRGQLKGYKLRVATICVDDFFKDEAAVLLAYDGRELPVDALPNNPRHWPSIGALEWHKSNMFYG
jgi:hypothetical protein